MAASTHATGSEMEQSRALASSLRWQTRGLANQLHNRSTDWFGPQRGHRARDSSPAVATGRDELSRTLPLGAGGCWLANQGLKLGRPGGRKREDDRKDLCSRGYRGPHPRGSIAHRTANAFEPPRRP
jgi:hypothetical protein